MSDGGISDTLEFWATINIWGNVDGKKLKSVMNDVRKVLNESGVNGEVVHSARLTVAEEEEPVVTISMKHSKNPLSQRRKRKNY